MRFQQCFLVLILLSLVARVLVNDELYPNCENCMYQMNTLKPALNLIISVSHLLLNLFCSLDPKGANDCTKNGKSVINLVRQISEDFFPENDELEIQPWLCSVYGACPISYFNDALLKDGFSLRCKTCVAFAKSTLMIMKGPINAMNTYFVEKICTEQPVFCGKDVPNRTIILGPISRLYNGELSPRQFCEKFTKCI